MSSPSYSAHGSPVALPQYTMWHPDLVTQDSKLPVALLLYFLLDLVFSVANYVAFIRHETAKYGKDFVKGYLAFVVLGIVFFAAVGGLMWVWAARYSITHKDRRRRTALGLVSVYLSNVLPLFILEYHAYLCCGWVEGYRGFCFVWKTFSFLGASILVWLSYAWRGARFMEMHYPLVGTKQTPDIPLGTLPRRMSTGSLGSPLMRGYSTGPPRPVEVCYDAPQSSGNIRRSSGQWSQRSGPEPFGYGGSLVVEAPQTMMRVERSPSILSGRTDSPRHARQVPFGYGGSLATVQYDSVPMENIGLSPAQRSIVYTSPLYQQPSEVHIVQSPRHANGSLYAERGK